MKQYNVILGDNRIQYGFKAENYEAALEFCKGYFNIPTSQMVIIENFANMPSECGRVVWCNSGFLRYEK